MNGTDTTPVAAIRLIGTMIWRQYVLQVQPLDVNALLTRKHADPSPASRIARHPALAVPHVSVPNIGHLDFEALRKMGCKGVVFDKVGFIPCTALVPGQSSRTFGWIVR